MVPETAAAATATGASPSETALQAIERGDATTLRALAESLTGRRPTAPVSPDGTTATRAVIEVPAVLGEPLPDACRAGAARLGLEPVDVELMSAGTAAAIKDFLAEYALWPSAAAFDRARDGVARLTLAAGEVDVPRDLAALFAETLSLFALHLYVNSAGIRYIRFPRRRNRCWSRLAGKHRRALRRRPARAAGGADRVTPAHRGTSDHHASGHVTSGPLADRPGPSTPFTDP